MPHQPPTLALLPAPPEAEAFWWREDGSGLTLDDVGGVPDADAAARLDALECDSARLLRAWGPALAPCLRSLEVAGALAPEPVAAGWGLWAQLGEYRWVGEWGTGRLFNDWPGRFCHLPLFRALPPQLNPQRPLDGESWPALLLLLLGASLCSSPL
jgi:hypothetical protein